MPKVSNVVSGRIDRGSVWTRKQPNLSQLLQKVHRQLGDYAVGNRPRLSQHPRDPMIVTCASWMRSGRFIPLYCNPSDMQWNLPRRGTVVKTAAGAVRNTWRNRYKGTYYDEGTVNITFQAGNIMPSMGYPEDAELRSYDNIASAIASPRVPPGLMDFYDFLELLNVGALMGSAANYHIIRHHSRVFPDLMMYGFFTEDSMSFSELATDGNTLQWSATFQIYRMVPNFSSASQMENVYTNWITSSAQDEAYGQDNVTRYLYGEGLGDVPGTMPSGQPKTGPNAAGAVKTVASSPQKTNNISDTMLNNTANKVKKDRDLGPLFAGF